jgi:predicted nucleic acid-binding protein
LVDDAYLIDWNIKIKEQTINLRKKYTIKLPDAIIAATSLANKIPLVTADKAFSKIEELDIILISL